MRAAPRVWSGTATWTGGLLGYSTYERGVAGDVALEMSL